MGSTNFTEHYDIPLPLGSDKTTPMDYNPSMQAIDTALFAAQGDASDAKTGLATTNQNVAQNTQNINALAGRVTSVEGTVSSQGTAITNLGTKIDGVEQDAQDMICAYNQASATASRNYAVGDYFIYNDVLYRATQAIASGATIVPDTNCTTTNVSAELKDISGDISQLNSDLSGKQDALTVTRVVNKNVSASNDYVNTIIYGRVALVNFQVNENFVADTWKPIALTSALPDPTALIGNMLFATCKKSDGNVTGNVTLVENNNQQTFQIEMSDSFVGTVRGQFVYMLA